MKRDFIQDVAMSVLLYGWPTWSLMKHLEKNLDGNNTRMLRVFLKKSWKQYHTKQQLHGQLPPISPTIKDEQEIWDIACEVKTNS